MTPHSPFDGEEKKREGVRRGGARKRGRKDDPVTSLFFCKRNCPRLTKKREGEEGLLLF